MNQGKTEKRRKCLIKVGTAVGKAPPNKGGGKRSFFSRADGDKAIKGDQQRQTLRRPSQKEINEGSPGITKVRN